MLLRAGEKRPFVWSCEELGAVWEGDAILLARRFSLAELGRKFSIGWFLPVILRFKRHLGEVFVGSFFLQTFGLITPLFSQVIIDKVLIHKGLSTLDVLVLGLFVINIFEMILGVTRTYLFSHTTNRVDVILGAKLFKHLLALPLPYFEARTVGTTIARVRELETIRSFITGTALTVVLDLIFTVVFVAVMFFYSPKLTLISLAALPFFVALSVVVTPIIRERLNKKFACNAESQSYLVEPGHRTAAELSLGGAAGELRPILLPRGVPEQPCGQHGAPDPEDIDAGYPVVRSADGDGRRVHGGAADSVPDALRPRHGADIAPGYALAGFSAGTALDRASWGRAELPC